MEQIIQPIGKSNVLHDFILQNVRNMDVDFLIEAPTVDIAVRVQGRKCVYMTITRATPPSVRKYRNYTLIGVRPPEFS